MNPKLAISTGLANQCTLRFPISSSQDYTIRMPRPLNFSVIFCFVFDTGALHVVLAILELAL